MKFKPLETKKMELYMQLMPIKESAKPRYIISFSTELCKRLNLDLKSNNAYIIFAKLDDIETSIFIITDKILKTYQPNEQFEFKNSKFKLNRSGNLHSKYIYTKLANLVKVGIKYNPIIREINIDDTLYTYAEINFSKTSDTISVTEETVIPIIEPKNYKDV